MSNQIEKVETGKWDKNGQPLYALNKLFKLAETIVPAYTLGGGCPKNSNEINTITDFITSELEKDENIDFTVSDRSVFIKLKLAFNWYPKKPVAPSRKESQYKTRRLYYQYRVNNSLV